MRMSENVSFASFPAVSYVGKAFGEEKETKLWGVWDEEKKLPVKEDTIFHACSISKWITAIVTMRLVEQGILKLDADIAGYLKKWELQYADVAFQRVTLRHLLGHTAGLVDGEDGFYGLRRNDKEVSLTDILSGKTGYNRAAALVRTDPGTCFEYSDAGYCLIQLVIEEVTGESFETVADRELIRTLALTHTFFGTLENLDKWEAKGNVAVGWKEDGSLIEGKYPYCPDLAASGLWSTPTELAAIAIDFLSCLQGEGRLLTKQSAQEMIQKAFEIDWMGLGILRYGDTTLVSKGWGEDAQCMLKMNLINQSVRVIMANKDPGVEQEQSGLGLEE